MGIRKIIIIIFLISFIKGYSQTKDEAIQVQKIITKADTLFFYRNYEKALKLYERAYKLCKCKYPYSQIRFIKDSNLIIKSKQNAKSSSM